MRRCDQPALVKPRAPSGLGPARCAGPATCGGMDAGRQMDGVLGRLLHWLGMPGFVRDASYDASIADVSVRVRSGARLTMVRVNGVEVYFDRASGDLAGIAVPESGLRWRVAPRGHRLAAAPWRDADRPDAR